MKNALFCISAVTALFITACEDPTGSNDSSPSYEKTLLSNSWLEVEGTEKTYSFIFDAVPQGLSYKTVDNYENNLEELSVSTDRLEISKKKFYYYTMDLIDGKTTEDESYTEADNADLASIRFTGTNCEVYLAEQGPSWAIASEQTNPYSISGNRITYNKGTAEEYGYEYSISGDTQLFVSFDMDSNASGEVICSIEEEKYIKWNRSPVL